MDANAIKAIQFSEKLLGASIDVVGAARVEINENWARDPKVVALAILSRTITNFRAAVRLVQQEHVLEARILVRGMYENLLWLGALRERGIAFVEEMRRDEAYNRKALGELVLKMTSKHGGDVGAPDSLKLRSLMKDLIEQFPDRDKLRTDKIAGMGPVETAYIEYQRLSLDAVHCSVTALGRHLVAERIPGRPATLTVHVIPKMLEGELMDTVLHACRALMGIAVGANEIIGFTNASGKLAALVTEFEKDGWAQAQLVAVGQISKE